MKRSFPLAFFLIILLSNVKAQTNSEAASDPRLQEAPLKVPQYIPPPEPVPPAPTEHYIPKKKKDRDRDPSFFRNIFFNISMGYLRGKAYSYAYDLNPGHFRIDRQISWNYSNNLSFQAQFKFNTKRLYFGTDLNLPIALGSDQAERLTWTYDDFAISAPSDAYSGRSEHNAASRLALMVKLNAGFIIHSNEYVRVSAGLALDFLYRRILAAEAIAIYTVNTGAGTLAASPLFIPENKMTLSSLYLAPGLDFNLQVFIARKIELGFNIGYSPATVWSNQLIEYTAQAQYDDIGFWGQLLSLSFYTRYWLGNIVAINLGVRYINMFESMGASSEYSYDITGETKGDLVSRIYNAGGTKFDQIQFSLGVILSLDLQRKIPKRKYPFESSN